MDWRVAVIVLLFVAGVLLAFPVAIGICAALGGAVMAVDRLTTRCPGCGRRRMRLINGIRETFPGGLGTGLFYRCSACDRRWFWSNDDRAWRDASAPEFAWAFDGAAAAAEAGAAADQAGIKRLPG